MVLIWYLSVLILHHHWPLYRELMNGLLFLNINDLIERETMGIVIGSLRDGALLIFFYRNTGIVFKREKCCVFLVTLLKLFLQIASLPSNQIINDASLFNANCIDCIFIIFLLARIL